MVPSNTKAVGQWTVAYLTNDASLKRVHDKISASGNPDWGSDPEWIAARMQWYSTNESLKRQQWISNLRIETSTYSANLRAAGQADGGEVG